MITLCAHRAGDGPHDTTRCIYAETQGGRGLVASVKTRRGGRVKRNGNGQRGVEINHSGSRVSPRGTSHDHHRPPPPA